MMAYKYFTEEDFKRAFPSCSLSDMLPQFLDMLDAARAIAGVPFKINSAFRSLSWEMSHGRSGSSSHCKGVAVDIACSDVFTRLRIVSSLIQVGFKRIGIASTFIHVDLDISKKSAIWLY